jgi:hypothetical protein
MTVEAARELGGSVEQLGKAFERVWKITSVDDLSYFVGVGGCGCLVHCVGALSSSIR